MRKVVAYELVSLDGVAEAPETFIPSWDEEMDIHLGAVIETQDAVILGRGSYDEWAAFWPTSEIQPFAGFINNVPKFIATSSALEPGWKNASVIEGELVEFVTALKAQPGRDIGVHASITITQALLAGGLIDELILVIAPTIAGAGRRLLEGVPSVKFEALESETSPSGYLMVKYGVQEPAVTR